MIILKFIFAVFLSFLPGFFGAMFSPGANPSIWYETLNKSALNPPSLVFPIVWNLLYLALGIALLGIGALMEVLGYGRAGKRWASVLVACPRCSGCGQRVGFQMAFCPGCGRTQGGGRPCARCGAWTLEGHRFCPACGHGLDGEGRTSCRRGTPQDDPRTQEPDL